MAEHRIEPRFHSRGRLRVVAQDGRGIDARVIDISPSGMGLSAGAALDVGSVISLEHGGIDVARGTVQHCRPSGERFFIGIALLEQV